MKAGQSLIEIATEIERQADAAKDFIAASQKIHMEGDGKHVTVPVPVNGRALERTFAINRIVHEQIGAHLGMHSTWYNKLLEKAPDILAHTINQWFERYPSRHTVRTLDDKVRAFMSDKYRAGLDNFSLLKAILPQLKANNQFEFVSGAVTEERFHIKLVDRSINLKLPTGAFIGDGSHTIVYHTHSPALYFGNSEVGRGSYFLELGELDTFCTNLMWVMKAMRKMHLGSRADVSDDVYQLLSEDTRRLTDQAIHAQVSDVMGKALSEDGFKEMMVQVAESAKDKIESDDIPEVVEVVGKRFDLNEGERKGVLTRLIEGGDLTRFGLVAAITRASADVEDYDRASDIERIGGNVITLPRNQWKTLVAEAGLKKAA